MSDLPPSTPSTAPGSPPEQLQGMVFPSDLETLGHWVRFSPFKYSRANRLSETATPQPITASIFLPVPDNLVTGYSMGYSEENLEAYGEGVVELAKQAKNVMSANQGKDKEKALSEAIDSLRASAVANLGGALAATGLALDQFTGGAISVGSGIQRNPHLALLFTGVNFRSHRFSYRFTARTPEEANILQQMIMTFKMAMHPNYKPEFQNHLFEYPDEFEIEFSDGLFAVAPSVLRDFSINYHGQGIPAYHPDKLPVEMHFDMMFQEIYILTKDDIQEGRNGVPY